MNTRSSSAVFDLAVINESHNAGPGGGTRIDPLELAIVSDPLLGLRPPAGDAARTEIVFIDSQVAGIDALLQGIGAGREVHLLDAGPDGLSQMRQILQGRSGIDALHVVSHGSAGAASLGSLLLDSSSAAGRADDLQAIGRSLAADGDLLLYGCATGAGPGAALLDQLAVLTGADIAASDDRTGAASRGGDWDLEVSSGHIDTPSLGTPELAALYQDVLAIGSATVTFTMNSPNFVSNGGHTSSSQDVIYQVNGNAAYQLKVDGALYGATSFAANYTFVDPSSTNAEASVTLSMVGGQVFSASSLLVRDMSESSQSLVFKGYDASNNLVSTNYLTVGSSSPGTVSFSGMTAITSLVMTATTNGDHVCCLYLDDLVLTDIGGDGTPPVVSSIVRASPSPSNASSLDYTVTFSESVTGVDTSDFTTTTNGTVTGTVSAVSGSGSSYTVTVSDIGGDGTLRLHLKASGTGITDTATNAITAGFGGQTYVIDQTGPPAPSTPDLSSASDSGSSTTDNITSNTTPTFTGTAELLATVVLYDSDGVTQLGSTTADSGIGSWSITSSALSAGTHTVTARATDTVGNIGSVSSGLTVNIDTSAPSVSSITRTAPALSNASSVDYTVTFSESLTGVGASDFMLTGTGGASGSITGVSGSGSSYTVTVGSVSGDGTLRLDLNASGTGITDAAGNAIAGGFTGGQAYTFDHTAPDAPSAPDLIAASDSGSSNTDKLTSDTTPTFTGTAGAAALVALYDTDGVTQLGSATADGNGDWSITSSALIAGAHTVTARTFDGAGNISSASAGLSFTIDAAAPSFSSASVKGNKLVLSYADTGSLDATQVPPTGAFAVVSGGAANAVTGVAVNAAAKTVTLTLDKAVSHRQAVTVAYTDPTGGDDANAIQDLAGNDAISRAATTVTNNTPNPNPPPPSDTTPPTATLSLSSGVLLAGQTAVLNIAFSEAPLGFALSDLSASGGSLSALGGTGNPLVYNALFTPEAGQRISDGSVTLAAGSYTDAAGNPGAAAARTGVQINTVVPSFNAQASSPADNTTAVPVGSSLTLQFSEALRAESAMGSVRLVADADGQVVPAIFAVAPGGGLLIDPKANLALDTLYHVEWPAGVLIGASGNAVPALASADGYNFRTAKGNLIDGTPVVVSSLALPDGNQRTTTLIGPVPAGRTDGPGSAHPGLADVPLVTTPDGHDVLTVSLSTGTSVQVQSLSGPAVGARQQLLDGLQSALPGGGTVPAHLVNGVDNFLTPLGSQANDVVVRTITVQPSPASGIELMVFENTTPQPVTTAVVISVPSDPTTIQLDNVDFAAVVGAVTLRGGDGQNVVVGDDAAQNILLGTGDDELHGGGGDDTVGSRGGNDQLFGDDGNDLVVGGIGDDTLHGGAGNDRLQGGQSDAGTWQFQIDPDGRLASRFVSRDADFTEVASLTQHGAWSAPGIDPGDDRLAYAQQSPERLKTVALLAHAALGQLPTLDQLNVWSSSSLSPHALAEAAMAQFVTLHPGFSTQPLALQVRSLVEAAWGPGAQAEAVMPQALAYMQQGGNWVDGLLALALAPAGAQPLTDTDGRLNLTQLYSVDDIGWLPDSGNDQLYGDAGDDRLVGGRGNDLLDGGSGIDTAVFTGYLADYQVQSKRVDGTLQWLLSHRASNETDTLVSIEQLDIGSHHYALRSDAAALADGLPHALAELVVEIELSGLPGVSTTAAAAGFGA